MGNDDNDRWAFPLTNLQIGDLQSYLSNLTLFLATESNKFYILVDNKPWVDSLVSRPAHLWQYMVTKSRESPFVNTRFRRGNKHVTENTEHAKPESPDSPFNCTKSKSTERWFSLLDSVLPEKKKLAWSPMKKLKYTLDLDHDLHRTLFGLIIFEVSWNDVRGLNYFNLLQIDTYMNVEAKYMKRWEFDNTAQAISYMPFWFSGTQKEQDKLMEYLLSSTEEIYFDAEEDLSDEAEFDNVINCHDAHADAEASDAEASDGTVNNTSVFPAAVKSMTGTMLSPSNVLYKRRKVTRFNMRKPEADTPREIGTPKHFEDDIEASDYKDILISFRFIDSDLPVMLRRIIISDLRLLTLLEAGLPSWVVLLQSYPLVCHIYRPWMCLLARSVYVVISLITVLIGFYDLYKNVPLLKATASRLFGPLFDWIETWEMVSRMKYLGTMLFLHNCQKALKWFWRITRVMRTFFSVLTRPMIGPLLEIVSLLLPMWNVAIDVIEDLFSVVWLAFSSILDAIGDVIEIIIFPFWFILSLFWYIATKVLLPIWWAVRGVLYAPIRLFLVLGNFAAYVLTIVCRTLTSLWVCVSGIVRVVSATETTVAHEASLWRALSHDLFSKVFRALRSVLNGFVAFFFALNRHRLSISNHISEFKRRVSGQPSDDAQVVVPYQRRQTSDTHDVVGRRMKFLTDE